VVCCTFGISEWHNKWRKLMKFEQIALVDLREDVEQRMLAVVKDLCAILVGLAELFGFEVVVMLWIGDWIA